MHQFILSPKNIFSFWQILSLYIFLNFYFSLSRSYSSLGNLITVYFLDFLLFIIAEDIRCRPKCAGKMWIKRYFTRKRIKCLPSKRDLMMRASNDHRRKKRLCEPLLIIVTACSLWKDPFYNVFPSNRNEKPAFLNSSGLNDILKKLRLRWTIHRISVDGRLNRTKLRFQISAVDGIWVWEELS